jgi:hypothetical protein
MEWKNFFLQEKYDHGQPGKSKHFTKQCSKGRRYKVFWIDPDKKQCFLSAAALVQKASMKPLIKY